MGAQAVRLSNVDIDNALNNRDFEVLFQPIFDLGNGALARMETFVRWRHASLGVLPPGAFISFFESQGRMSELSRYVLNEALSNYLGWRGNYGPGFSINLALTDLADEAIASHLTVLLREHDFPTDAVTLECPMPPVTMDPDQAREQFMALRETGARLAIEVRGRANEFLRTVDPFPFDEIKTGGAAILRFARTVRGPGLSAISELLDIANNANASITAVGVEDQASLSALRGLGFSAAQGNHLAKVGTLKDFRPAMVNGVRKLLDLDDLSQTELSELFRTGHPENKSALATQADPVPAIGTEKADTGSLETEDAQEEILDANTPLKQDQATAPESTAERARRKAALLAKKKGKDALRAEITARRAKLGLSAPAGTEPQIAAAKGLQDRLANEFVVDADTSKEDTIPQKAAVSEQSSALDATPISEPENTNQVEPETTKTPQQSDAPVASAGSEQKIAAISDDITDNLAQINAAETEASSPQPELFEQTETQSEQKEFAQTTAEEEAGSAVTGSETQDSPRPQDNIEPVPQALTNTSENPADETDTLEAGTLEVGTLEVGTLTAQTDTSTTNDQPASITATKMAIPDAGAYMITTYHASLEMEQAIPAETASAQAMQEQKNLEDSLFLFSPDEISPKSHKPQNNGETAHNILAADEIRESAENPTSDSRPPVSPPSETDNTTGEQSSQPESFADDVTSSNVEEAALTTDAPAPEQDFTEDAENLEAEMLEASRNARVHRGPKTGRHQKNFLMRKYRIWPDHFWPRSWKRAWRKRQANRDFVKRAQNIADNLASDDNNTQDRLF